MSIDFPRLLLTCRDPGCAGHLAAIWRHLDAHGWEDKHVVVSGAAASILVGEGLPVEPFALPSGADTCGSMDDGGPLLDAVGSLLEQVRPEVALTMLSSEEAGIDEAVAALATCPKLCLQDYWGDVNMRLGVASDMYLVLDKAAAELTAERFGLQVAIVGSPKHDAYREMDILALRDTARKRIGAAGEERVIGWFAQTPSIPGHDDAFGSLVKATASLSGRPLLLVRGHPKYTKASLDYVEQARESGLAVFDATGMDSAELWLCGCDVVCTAYSTCGLDHAYLSAFSPEPIGVVVYLASTPQLEAHIRQTLGEPVPMPVSIGLGEYAGPMSNLSQVLRRALAQEEVRRYHRTTKVLERGDSCARVMRQLLALAGR